MTMKTVYVFGGAADHSDPRQKDKTVVGGKGANLAEMASIGLPVPPGFTITTEECVAYLQDGTEFSDGLRAAVAEALKPRLPQGWRIHANGNNLAFLPPWLSKRAAVRYMLEQVRCDTPERWSTLPDSRRLRTPSPCAWPRGREVAGCGRPKW